MEPNEDLSEESLATRPTTFAPGLFNDQVVVISGGGSGIGRATAWLAARLGARVLIYGRKAEKVQREADAISARGWHCECGVLDVRDRAAVDSVMAEVFERHGKLDLLFNNAGGHFPSAAIDISAKGWSAVIENNLTGTFNMMQSAARQWRDRGSRGCIVNMAMSMRALGGLAHSAASRAAIITFSEKAAVEWAQYGIRINCISPGAIATEIWREEERALYREGNLQRRVSDSWETAEATLFLASPAAAFIHGHNLIVDGGAALWGEAWPTGKPAYLAEATRAWDRNADLLTRWRR
jgi:citronellol/citronellal dehydrogenase